jgi:pimeloyl-ACP methyl ester carboxylesterase
MGHSYGGGGAMYAASSHSNPAIKLVLGLSPVPGSSYYTSDDVPSLILCGQDDQEFQGWPQVEASIPSATTLFFAEFKDLGQFDDMHDVGLNPLGWHTTDPVVASRALSFLQVHLNGDQRFAQFLTTDPTFNLYDYNNP